MEPCGTRCVYDEDSQSCREGGGLRETEWGSDASLWGQHIPKGKHGDKGSRDITRGEREVAKGVRRGGASGAEGWFAALAAVDVWGR